jgi:hypothetical protein
MVFRWFCRLKLEPMKGIYTQRLLGSHLGLIVAGEILVLRRYSFVSQGSLKTPLSPRVKPLNGKLL